MNIIDGKEIRESLKTDVKEKINSISNKLKLVVFMVGDNSSSEIYVRNKKTLCEELGIICEVKKYSEISEEDLIKEIDNCNSDENVTGIIVQLPLPSNINESNVIESINPSKDVDGLTSTNEGKLALGEPSLIPCTALGIMKMLEYHNINLSGLNTVIVGRSRLVGLPLASLFLNSDATVTVCHSKTNDLKSITKTADILVTAIGKKEYFDESFIKDGAIVIDVGINREDGKVYGDCNFESMKDKSSLITPVPGGVGILTVTMLVNNVIQAYYMQT